MIRKTLKAAAPATTPTPGEDAWLDEIEHVVGGHLMIERDKMRTILRAYRANLLAQAAAPGGKEPLPWLYAIQDAEGRWKDGESCVFSDLASAQDEVDLLNDGVAVGVEEEYKVVPLYRALAASHPLQDKPPRVPRKCQRCGADLPGSSSFSVCGGDCRKPQEQPPAAPRCESFDVEGIMTDYCTLTKGHIGPHWGKHWNWAAQDKPTPGETR